VLAGEDLPGGLLLLLARPGTVGPVTLVAVGADLSRRSFALAAIQGGSRPPAPADGAAAREYRPALAVTPNGDRAVVIGAEASAAVVDLRSGDVSYRELRARTTAARAKAIEGATRYARWIDGTRLAVSGSDTQGVTSGGRVDARPFGLHILDTAAWTMSPVDVRAAGFALAGRHLLVAPPVGGMAGYGFDGTRAYGVFGAQRVSELAVVGSRAYVQIDGNFHWWTIDAATGAALGRHAGRPPYLLQAEHGHIGL
jgi:hypothetical protein